MQRGVHAGNWQQDAREEEEEVTPLPVQMYRQYGQYESSVQSLKQVC